ncbi:MAG TPA: CheR family methyltransferase [Candidatus Dormibacteraeota bacterium]|nr:CheR family methyltransferase [Candidatus Dormibacteraeota bacterium]
MEAAARHLESLASDVEAVEVQLLVEGMRLSYGYDFREYSPSALRRSIQMGMIREGAHTVSAYQDRVLHDPACMQRLLGLVGMNVTSMFRDPELIKCLRHDVIPLFKTYPSVRIWVVGCATGEEAYSLAIALKEEALLKRASIYATDLNDDTLAIGRQGEYPLDRVRRYSDAYQVAGGRGNLSDHYAAAGRNARFDGELRAGITWARHNLVTDGSFNDFHLILCANVLIYFKPSLQERAHRLFYDSLIRGGFLALGRRESLIHCADRDHYEQVREGINLFRKMRW